MFWKHSQKGVSLIRSLCNMFTFITQRITAGKPDPDSANPEEGLAQEQLRTMENYTWWMAYNMGIPAAQTICLILMIPQLTSGLPCLMRRISATIAQPQ